MSVKSGQAVTTEFTTADPTTAAATDADSLPTGTLVVNGTDNAATVTVTNKTTGVYKAVVTLPALSAGDIVGIRIAATVGGVAGVAKVWEDVADTKRVSELNDIAAGAEMALTAAYEATLTAAIEAALLDEGDATALLQAIADKISGDWTAGDLSALAIAAAVRADLATELARIDASISSRLATSGYTAPDNAGIVAVRTQTDQLTFTDGKVDANATATVDAQAIRDALGMAAADMDAQLDAIAAQIAAVAAYQPGDTLITETTKFDAEGNIDTEGTAYGITTPGASLTLFASTDTGYSDPVRHTTAAADGTWSIGVPSGTFTLVVAKDGYYDADDGDSVITRTVVIL